MSTIQPGGD